MKRALRFINREEGVSMVVIMLIAVALLLTVPVFVDYASLHYTRRVTQTGADAAALAAAVSYAEELSGHWPAYDTLMGWMARMLCCRTVCMPTLNKTCVTLYYVLHTLLFGNLDNIGEEDAEDYAEKNGTEMEEYDTAPFPFMGYSLPRIYVQRTDHLPYCYYLYVPVPPIGVEVTVSRKAPMIYGQLYGQDEFVVKASAIAEAYLDKADKSQDWCVTLCCACNPYGCICAGSVPAYDFHWKVRLVE